jgi:protoporphyrinogen oxidase
MINYHMDPFTLDVRARADDVAATDFYTRPVVHLSITRALALVGALSEPEDMGLSLHHLHRLIHIILFTDYLSLASGTDSLHEAIAARLPVRLESPAVGLLEEGGRITGVELENERIPADHVVVATTPSAAASLIPPDWNPEREFLSGIKIPSFTLPTFFLDRPLEKNVWSYLLHQHNRKISYLTDAAQKNPEMVPSGKAVIQPWVCYPHSAELAGCSDEDIIKLCTDELEDIFPGFGSWIEEVHITRHPYGVPFHSVGHVQKACDFMKRMDRRKVSFCGDYFSGGYVESALWSAERAAKVFG